MTQIDTTTFYRKTVLALAVAELILIIRVSALCTCSLTISVTVADHNVIDGHGKVSYIPRKIIARHILIILRSAHIGYAAIPHWAIRLSVDFLESV